MGPGHLPLLLLILLPALALADNKNFNPTQDIGTLGSTAIQSFACGSFDCLVIAQQNVSSGAFETILYILDEFSLQFASQQVLDTAGLVVQDVRSFNVSDDLFLAVSTAPGVGQLQQPSLVLFFQWSDDDAVFEPIDPSDLGTSFNATAVAVNCDPDTYTTLLFAVGEGSLYSFNLSTYAVAPVQLIPDAAQSMSASFFARGGQLYLLTTGINTTVYVWNATAGLMTVHQELAADVSSSCATFEIAGELFAVLTSHQWALYYWNDSIALFEHFEQGGSGTMYPSVSALAFEDVFVIAFPLPVDNSVELYHWDAKLGLLSFMQVVTYPQPTAATFLSVDSSIYLVITGALADSAVLVWTPHPPTSRPQHHVTGPSAAEIVIITIGIIVFVVAVVGAVVVAKRILKRKEAPTYMQIES